MHDLERKWRGRTLENIAKLEEKITQILNRVKQLEQVKKDLTAKNQSLEKELKEYQLKLEQADKAKLELESHSRDKDSKVHNRLTELLGKLEEVETELVWDYYLDIKDRNPDILIKYQSCEKRI